MVKPKKQTKLQQITEEAWLVTKGDKKIGILNEDVQGRYFYITGKSVKLFDDEQETTKFFGNVNLFTETINEPTTKKDALYIKGHHIEYEEAIPIEVNDTRYRDDIPLYLKTESSDVLYAAGWYAINFDKAWKHGHGPKLQTLESYGFEGPWRTEMECRKELKRLNKEKRHNEQV
jgi:hypothetical protein